MATERIEIADCRMRRRLWAGEACYRGLLAGPGVGQQQYTDGETDMDGNLNLYNVADPREKAYYALVLTISVIAWLFLVLPIFPLFYAFMALVAIWFANGLLVAQLRADGVKIDAEQLPELDQALREACAKLEIAEIPELYIIESGGMLNAFATRHSGRKFIVVYSDLLEAYGSASPELKFLLGHELGHIKRKHIIKQLFLFPGLLVPLLGNAYSRACESSCDRYGALASEDVDASITAMMVLSGGRTAGKMLNPISFAAQYSKMRGFFVSWYELISGYPTLSQRVAQLLALKDGRTPDRSPRNPVAYVFALFTVGGRGAGGTNLMITVAVIGLLAAIAIPSFVQAREAAQRNACINNLRQIDGAKDQAAVTHNYRQDAVIPEDHISASIPRGLTSLRCMGGGVYTVNPLGEDCECSVHGSLNAEYPEPDTLGVGPQ